MGKKLFSSSRSNATVELCREWIGKFLQGMLDAGFIQTGDTGQVVPSQIELLPSQAATVYAVFRFNDELQSSHPVFFKVEFNISSSTSAAETTRGMWLTIGSGTDGSGNVVGTKLARTSVGNQALASDSYAASGSIYQHIAFSGSGYCGLIGYVNDPRVTGLTPYIGCSFLIERSRSQDGAISSEGLLVYVSGVANNNSILTATGNEATLYAINYLTGEANSGGVPVMTLGTVNGVTLGPSASLASGSIGPVFPWDVVAPGLVPWRSRVAVSIPAGDHPGGIFETSVSSVRGTYYPVRVSLANNRFGLAITANGAISRHFGVGVLWED